jgi:hypothetical protein
VNVGTGLLFVVDEYGPRLKTLLDPRGYQREMRALLLQLATIGTGDYVAATSMARGGQDKLIQVPSISLLGSSTPQTLHDVLARSAMDDGFLGRHLFFSALDRLPEWRELTGDDPVPPEIDGAVSAVRTSHEKWYRDLPRNGVAADGVPLLIYKALAVPDKGGAVLDDFRDECDHRRRDPKESETVPKQILGRATEHAQRVALCLAVLSQPQEAIPVVTDEIARIAIDVVRASQLVITKSIDLYGADSDHERDRKRVLLAIRDLGGDQGEWVTQRAILRVARYLKRQEVSEILARLADEESVQLRKVPSGDRGGGKERIEVRLVLDRGRVLM